MKIECNFYVSLLHHTCVQYSKRPVSTWMQAVWMFILLGCVEFNVYKCPPDATLKLRDSS